MYSHCATGGWILGNTIDGTQAEYVRIPHADTSLYPIPAGADEEALVMLSDILPTGFECGVLNGKVQPGDTVAIVGAGPIGLAALLTAQFYSPAEIIMIDLDDNRLEVARALRRDRTRQQRGRQGRRDGDGADRRARRRYRHRGRRHARHLRHLRGASWRRAARIANVGVHGSQVDAASRDAVGRTTSRSPRGWSTPSTTPMLLKIVQSAKKLEPKLLITHRFTLRPVHGAYDDVRQRRREQGAQGDHRPRSPPNG